VELAARSAQLEPTPICLTHLQNQMTGSYSLAARLVGRGERDYLLRALHGSFELTARNGEFIRSPGIDATFDYLNATGDFQFAFPDLDRQTFPYRFVGVKGRIEGKMLIGDEINVSSSLINLSGQAESTWSETRLTAKAKPVDEMISWIPGISSMLGGSRIGTQCELPKSLNTPKLAICHLPRLARN
jgi:hypothetical protein